jgi:oligopeptide transport system substrate-binding protein
MRWFYIFSLLAIAAMSAWPYYYLSDKARVGQAGKAGVDGVVTYACYFAKVRSLDPATCGDEISGLFQSSIYEGLYEYHFLKRPVEIIPSLADGMPEISDDLLTYTIKIKKGVKYCHNACFGTNDDGLAKTRTVTAHDFVLAFKRIADSHLTTSMSLAFIEDKIVGLKEYRAATMAFAKGDFSRYDTLDFAGVKALDDYTLQIKLVTPFPQLVYVLAITCYAPIPHELIDYYFVHRNGGEEIPLEKRNTRITDKSAMVGTGAYYMYEFVDGGDIIMKRNPDYRDDFYPTQGEPDDAKNGLLADAGKKLPFVDTRYYKYIPEFLPMWEMFRQKQLDATLIPPQFYHQAITPSKELTDSLAKEGVQLVKYTRPTVFWFAFNMEDKVIGKSKSLRQALCLAFDVEAYIDVLFNGRGIRATNIVPDNFGTQWDVQACKDAGPSPYAKFDLALAREKIKQAKVELEQAGVIGPGEAIPTLTLDLGGMDDLERRMGELAKKQFHKIGVELKVELNDWPTLQQKVENKNCQLYAMGWGADYPDAEAFFQVYYGPNIKRGTNGSNYQNDRFDYLYEQSVVMPPSPKRAKLYTEMLKIVQEDCPSLLLTEPIMFVPVQGWVHNAKPHPFGYGATGFAKYTRIDATQRKAEGGP